MMVKCDMFRNLDAPRAGCYCAVCALARRAQAEETAAVMADLRASENARAVFGASTKTIKGVRPAASLPLDSQRRKDLPVAAGFLDYFPLAVAACAHLSKIGNDKHNPGEPLHWSRGKSNDHADTLVRHLMERSTVDDDGVPHVVKVAWRACALAQVYLEENGWKGVLDDATE